MIFDVNPEAPAENLLTSDGLLVSGKLNGQDMNHLIRANVDTTSEPGFILVTLEVKVNNQWLSTGTGRHNA